MISVRSDWRSYIPNLNFYDEGPGMRGCSLSFGARGADPLWAIDVQLPHTGIDWSTFARTKGGFAESMYGFLTGPSRTWVQWGTYWPPLPRLSVADSLPTFSAPRGGISFFKPPSEVSELTAAKLAYAEEHDLTVPEVDGVYEDGKSYVWRRGAFLHLEGGSLDIGLVRPGAPWWRPLRRRRLRRESKATLDGFRESFSAHVNASAEASYPRPQRGGH